jgi:hypothetical protein
MRRAAVETAARWQWSDFRLALARNVIEGLRDAGYSECIDEFNPCNVHAVKNNNFGMYPGYR